MIVRLHPDRPDLFPDPAGAEPSGLLAVGGDLTPERLIAAYSLGIFPWYGEGSPILWWSPDPRCVLLPETFHLPRSLRRIRNREARQPTLRLTYDAAFDEVVRRCAAMPRPGQDGTWIVPAMVEAYSRLHALGAAHSAEAWDAADGGLVGGIYGVALGRAFFAESMFHSRAYASKLLLAALAERLWARGCAFIDCQMPTPHVMGFGGTLLPRTGYLALLRAALAGFGAGSASPPSAASRKAAVRNSDQ